MKTNTNSLVRLYEQHLNPSTPHRLLIHRATAILDHVTPWTSPRILLPDMDDAIMVASYRERLLDEARRSLPESDLPAVEHAIAFATQAHGEQRRLSGLLYITHPLETARKLAAMGLPRDVVIAGILHDTYEDA
ncbi:MAG: HD domain-containing protein, partial [bacterium]|nr:HD domain-containing protein [bacterium]